MAITFEGDVSGQDQEIGITYVSQMIVIENLGSAALEVFVKGDGGDKLFPLSVPAKEKRFYCRSGRHFIGPGGAKYRVHVPG